MKKIVEKKIKTKLIRVKIETYERLKEIARYEDTMNTVIDFLIEFFKKNSKKD